MDAVKMVTVEENGRKEIDIKRYARVEKVPGGSIEDSHVLRGVMLNKDVVHPKMRRCVCVCVCVCVRAHTLQLRMDVSSPTLVSAGG